MEIFWTAIGGAAAVVLTAGSWAVVRIFRARHEEYRKDESATVTELRGIIDDLRIELNDLRRVVAARPNNLVSSFNVTCDGTGLILFITPDVFAVLHWYPEELIGCNVKDTLVPERYKARHEAGMIRLRSSPADWQGKQLPAFGVSKDGREIPVQITLTTWQNGQGNWLANALVAERPLRLRPTPLYGVGVRPKK